MIEAFEKLSLTSSQYYTQLSTSQFSQRLIDCPPIKRLDSIVITNFKSFSIAKLIFREHSLHWTLP